MQVGHEDDQQSGWLRLVTPPGDAQVPAIAGTFPPAAGRPRDRQGDAGMIATIRQTTSWSRVRANLGRSPGCACCLLQDSERLRWIPLRLGKWWLKPLQGRGKIEVPALPPRSVRTAAASCRLLYVNPEGLPGERQAAGGPTPADTITLSTRPASCGKRLPELRSVQGLVPGEFFRSP